jgi:prepilin-type N-terminal cleavage/methylation domain-containing protein/prepilin-type processing-associated H-X9-DG protein
MVLLLFNKGDYRDFKGHIMRKFHGFTLIELLVVIAIIALLMGILMPALNRVKSMGKRVSCMNNMRQVGITYQMYMGDNEKLPPKRHPAGDFNHPDAAPNVLNLLLPYLAPGNERMSPKAYNCPALKPNPESRYAPTEYSSTSFSANTVPLGRKLTDIPRAGQIIILQEAWSHSNQLWNQPEPVDRSQPALEGKIPNTYHQWHMYASHSIHPSYTSIEMREHLSNVHSEGGNLIYADGHAEYRKYYDLRSSDFGLLPDELYEPTHEQSYGKIWDPAF